MKVFGIDFSSRPSRRKPIVIACARLAASSLRPDHWVLTLDRFEKIHTLDEFAEWLETPGPWLGGKFAHRACDIPAGASPSMK